MPQESRAANPGDLQDGILAYYLSQAPAADVNVTARIEREPFDWRDYARPMRNPSRYPLGRGHKGNR